MEQWEWRVMLTTAGMLMAYERNREQPGYARRLTVLLAGAQRGQLHAQIHFGHVLGVLPENFITPANAVIDNAAPPGLAVMLSNLWAPRRIQVARDVPQLER